MPEMCRQKFKKKKKIGLVENFCYFFHMFKVLCYLQFLKTQKLFEKYLIISVNLLIQYYQQKNEDFAMERRFVI